ncbi:MAG: hypothetical protein J6K25_01850 [Thermoguttaceae bacterium]|nr:hypothetical protein [Thermoguttaceae bacterium]
MNWKTWLWLFVALVTGGAAALGVKSIFFVESDEVVEEVAVAPGAKTQILVANVDLPAGSELNAQNVRLTLAPENEIPREMQPLSFSEAVGALTARDLKAGEPISLFDVAALEESASPEETYVKPGYAIVPIEIQTATKAGGGRDFLKTTKLDKMLKPGDVVDLAVVKEDKSVAPSALGVAPRRRLTTETIVEGVEVFSVADASRFSQETGVAERASTVCVQLSQEQLAAALKAAEQGRVKIIPRVDQAEFETGSADAPLALDGNFNGGAFEPPMNADFSFSGLTEETTAPQIVENEASNAAKAEDADANDSVPFEIATEEETPVVDEKPEANPTPDAAPVPFEIATEEETPVADEEPEANSTPDDALVPFEIATEEETPNVDEEPEPDSEKTTPFRLRNASVRSESADAEEAEDEENAEETPDGAAAPLAPTKEPRQAFGAPYRESVVEPSVAEEASAASGFKYVSPFVTVNPKTSSTSVAPIRRARAFSR